MHGTEYHQRPDMSCPWVVAISRYDQTMVARHAAAALGAVSFQGMLDPILCKRFYTVSPPDSDETFVAVYHRSERDLVTAAANHTKAVQILSKNLASLELSRAPGNVAAILFLFWFEVSVGERYASSVLDLANQGKLTVRESTDMGWAQHNQGLSSLIEHCGPEAHCHWLSRK